MILDTSAVIEVIDATERAPAIEERLLADDHVAMSAATAVELTAVLMRYREPAMHALVQRALDDWGVEVVPFDEEQARIAQQAYRDFGRGSGHAAGLNMGDCYSYALATVRREALLYVGDDFVHTDVLPALE